MCLTLPALQAHQPREQLQSSSCIFSTSHLLQQLKITYLLKGRKEPCNGNFQGDVKKTLTATTFHR